MKTIIFEKTRLAVLAALCTGAVACSTPAPTPDTATTESTTPSPGEPPMEVTRPSDRGGTIPGGDEHFTGEATIQMLFGINGPRNFNAAYVTFQPSARTNWHTHPAGQTLVVTEGTAWVQLEGEARQELEPGDVIWTPPGVRHWHGATPFRPMTHMALQSGVNGEVVDWQEHVTDEQYNGEAAE